MGGEAIPIQTDVRDENAIKEMVDAVVQAWGGVDILINNASALNLMNTERITAKQFDLIMNCNVRATFLSSQAVIPYLKQSKGSHILTMSPPLSLNAKWYKDYLGYSISKYGMSMCTLGLAEQFKDHHIHVNSLWPKTTIATAAVEVNLPPQVYQASRKASIMADAAYSILTDSSQLNTGQFYLDEDRLKESDGVTNFDSYALNPGVPLFPDAFVD